MYILYNIFYYCMYVSYVLHVLLLLLVINTKLHAYYYSLIIIYIAMYCFNNGNVIIPIIILSLYKIIYQ